MQALIMKILNNTNHCGIVDVFFPELYFFADGRIPTKLFDQSFIDDYRLFCIGEMISRKIPSSANRMPNVSRYV